MKQNSLKQRWQALDGKYAALSRRERGLVAAALAALVLFLGNTLWAGPAAERARTFARQAEQQERQVAQLQAQIQVLRAQVAVDPNTPLRSELEKTGQQLAAADRRLQEFERSLVPPAKMPVALEGLLGQVPGVRLLSLKSLPAEPVLAAAEASAANMYKHGFELKLEGSYPDLASYLGRLEQQPQQLLWQRASLAVVRYPTAVLTLTFYSLSLDKELMAL